MKKKLFLTLLMTLLLLLAAATALAESPSDYDCPSCGEPCTEWFPFTATDGITLCHAPICASCWIFVYEGTARCTFDESTATCTKKPVCSVCGCADTVNGAVNPNAHNFGQWSYSSSAQHFRFCLDCMATDSYEYEDHYGGTATCTELAICEVCGEGYGDVDTSSHQITDWACYSAEKHYRYCDLCAADDTYEYEDHYGGTATCTERAVCEGCGAAYGMPDTENHDWGAWEGYDGEQHLRTCKRPGCNAEELGSHSGGTATCAAYAICEGCGELYGERSTQHGAMTQWVYADSGRHFRRCQDCGLNQEYEDHYGGTATCAKRAVCEGCGNGYGDFDTSSHQITDWACYSTEKHYRYCELCGADDTYEYENHYGGTASCSQKAICQGCGYSYGDYTPRNHLNMSDWEPDGSTRHSHYCLDCASEDSYEYEDHYGGSATCAELAVCVGCGESYGELAPHGNMSRWHYASNTQHSRYCIVCTSEDSYEYEDHSGGTATCIQKAVCDVCGQSYGELSDEHLSMMEQWSYYSPTQHRRWCTTCGAAESFVYEDHYGGTATCTTLATCEGCGMGYGELASDNHLNMCEWTYYTRTQHRRWCLDCGVGYEYEDHYGGSATCNKQAICEGCGEPHGKLADEHPNLSDWKTCSNTQHYRYCLDCGTYEEYEDHTGGTATCSTQALCVDCEAGYGDLIADAHEWGDWFPDETGTHFRTCGLNGEHIDFGTCSGDGWSYLTDEYHMQKCSDCGGKKLADHTGGTATCTEKAVCDVCNAEYGELATSAHQWGKWTPNADGTHTRVCSVNSEHTETADCSFGDWTLADDQYHLRTCTVCGNQKTGEHTGGTATCTSPRICETCGEGYGTPDNSGLSGHPNPVIEQKSPTCYDEGYYRVSCDEPGCSMPFFEIVLPTNGQHIYNDWQPLSDGTHIAGCAFCGTELIVPCTPFTADDFTVCPICGEYDGGVLPVLLAREDDALPYGTLIVRGGECPADGVLWAFTVAGSYGGHVVEPQRPLTICIPMALDSFRIVGMDGAEISFTLADGLLTVETAEAGLFLLLPAM